MVRRAIDDGVERARRTLEANVTRAAPRFRRRARTRLSRRAPRIVPAGAPAAASPAKPRAAPICRRGPRTVKTGTGSRPVPPTGAGLGCNETRRSKRARDANGGTSARPARGSTMLPGRGPNAPIGSQRVDVWPEIDDGAAKPWDTNALARGSSLPTARAPTTRAVKPLARCEEGIPRWRSCPRSTTAPSWLVVHGIRVRSPRGSLIRINGDFGN
jgi:hypothetical protein